MLTLNRRQLLLASGAALLGVDALRKVVTAQEGGTKKVLFFTKSSGFQHSVINRQGGETSHAERILTEIGKEHGFEVVASKDGRLFDPDKIDQWDAFAFYTTGDLTKPGNDGQPPMSPEGEAALYEAIRGGKGLIGMHCATDTFGKHRGQGADDPYTKLIGGEFAGHGAQQVATIEVVGKDFPGAEPFGDKFELNDEWYGLRHLNDDMRVLMVQVTEGMQGRDYERPNFPMTWTRKEGDGRVFYTSMGHREDVWENPLYQGLLIGALKVVTKQAEADFEPNIQSVTPNYNQMPGA
ncbi:hypothetical protein BH23PLA1_BH23PLA1_22630 [soil metagenome]